MPRPRKLTLEQHRHIAERHRLYMLHRIEAAKHSPYRLSQELGVSERTVEAYIDRPLMRQG